MSLSGKEYEKMTKRASPPSPKLMNLLKAFLIGGLICAIGEGFSMLDEVLFDYFCNTKLSESFDMTKS